MPKPQGNPQSHALQISMEVVDQTHVDVDLFRRTTFAELKEMGFSTLPRGTRDDIIIGPVINRRFTITTELDYHISQRELDELGRQLDETVTLIHYVWD